MQYLKVLKTDAFWWIMLGYVLGLFIGHEFVLEQVDSDWNSLYELSWHPFLVQLYILASWWLSLLLVITLFLLLMTLIQKVLDLITFIVKRLWQSRRNQDV